MRIYAKELVSLIPEVIITRGGAVARAVQQETSVILVMIAGVDSAANGLVHDIAHPEDYVTGFPALEPSIIDKQLS